MARAGLGIAAEACEPYGFAARFLALRGVLREGFCFAENREPVGAFLGW
jgi:hypothetical protein